MTEAEARAAVVAEARSWVGTGYQHAARVKGVAVDCGQVIIAVYAAVGLIEDFQPQPYPPDFMMHRDEERYLELVERFATEFDWTAEPILPADIVVWRYGRTFSHGGIVTAWPHVVHAFAPYRFVDESDVSRPSELTLLKDGRPRPMRAFRLKGLGATGSGAAAPAGATKVETR